MVFLSQGFKELTLTLTCTRTQNANKRHISENADDILIYLSYLNTDNDILALLLLFILHVF